MKVYLDGLAGNRRYALQVMGQGDIETAWSPTYVITTERDRIAPPLVPNIGVYNSAIINNIAYWYKKDLIITWDDYGVSDESTWDHNHYVVEFMTVGGTVARFTTVDKKFELTYALNRATFGGNGCPKFQYVSVWGVDRTGNPSVDNVPWLDGPHVSVGSVSRTPYGALINPPPSPVENVTWDFETKDAILKWDLPSSIENSDNVRIEITLTADTTQVISIPYETTQYTLSYDENRTYFNNGKGSPRVAYSIKVYDPFEQVSTAVTGVMINLPPQQPVQGLESTGVIGGIDVVFDDIKTVLHKDHLYTMVYEKPVVGSNNVNDGPPGSFTGYVLIDNITGNSMSYIPSSYVYEGTTITARGKRWIRAAYVDAFGQLGPVTNAGKEYPAKMIFPVNIDVTAPPPPTNVAVRLGEPGSFGIEEYTYITWTPTTEEKLYEHYVEFQEQTATSSDNPNWTSVKSPTYREYVNYFDTNKVYFEDDVNQFSVGDYISIVNVGTAGAVQSGNVTAVASNYITVDFTPSGAILKNDNDRKNPATSVVRSSCPLNLKPGARYKVRVRSAGSTATSEPSSEIEFLTPGNALVAKIPIEVGTYYDPLVITGYKAESGTFTVYTAADPRGSNYGFTSPNVASGIYCSIRNSEDILNGRYRVTGSGVDYITFNKSGSVPLTATTGMLTAGTFALGAEVDGINSGLFIDSSNYWYSSGYFRAGYGYGSPGWTGFDWNPSTQKFSVSGDMSIRTGILSGNLILSNGGSIVIGQSLEIDKERDIKYTSPNLVVPYVGADLVSPAAKAQVLASSAQLKEIEGLVGVATVNTVNKTVTINIGTGFVIDTQRANGRILFGNVVAMGDSALVSTDETGDIKFMLTNSGKNRIGGWDITNNAIRSPMSVAENLRAGMSADPALPSFWAGGNPANAVFRVDEDGSMFLGSDTVTGTFNIGNAGATKGIRIIAGGTDYSKMYAGPGTYGNANTPFYLGANGKFSLSNRFTVDASSANTTVYIGDNTSTNKFIFEAGSAPKFYQSSNASPAWGQSDTNIYLDYNGQFSIGGFLKINKTSAVFDLPNGTIKIGDAFADGAGIIFSPKTGGTASNSLRIGRNSGSSYSAGVYFPATTEGWLQSYIASDQNNYPMWIVGARNNEAITQLYTHNSLDDTYLWSKQSLVLTASGWDAYLTAYKGINIRADTEDIDIYAPLSRIRSYGNSIEWISTSRNYVFADGWWPPNTAATYELRMGAYGEIKYRNDGLYSSRAFKRDIMYLTESDRVSIANDILKLEPVIFRYKSSPIVPTSEDYQIGYIVEDLDENEIIWPLEISEDQAYGLNYDKIIVGAAELLKIHQLEIQELKQSVIQLNERIAELEGE